MERRAFRLSGFVVLVVLIALVVVHVMVGPRVAGSTTRTLLLVLLIDVPFVLIATGLTVVNPNEARVVQFFGRYIGSVREAGFWWTLPLTNRRRMSLRVRNFETARLKVSDFDGNPVEIAAVVVWQV